MIKKEKFSCWRVGKNNELLITYPESEIGHDLISCSNCGHIYSVNVAKRLYSDIDINNLLESFRCLNCNSVLADNWLEYPENFVRKDGSIGRYRRSRKIPDENDSVVVEIDEVYTLN